MDEERKQLTAAEAEAMLQPDADLIHTFRQPAGTNLIVGADWTRERVLQAFQVYPVELSGPSASSMGHKIAFCDQTGWVFVMTRVDP